MKQSELPAGFLAKALAGATDEEIGLAIEKLLQEDNGQRVARAILKNIIRVMKEIEAGADTGGAQE